MASPWTLALFPTRSRDGLALAEQIRALAEAKGFHVVTYPEATSPQYGAVCEASDAVVLDATLERKGEHNYHFAMPLSQDHVLVVSRTYLPMNFVGMRDRIVEPETGCEIFGCPMYPQSLSNEAILRWVDLQLCDLRKSFETGKSAQTGLVGHMLRGYEVGEQNRKLSGAIFISYRNSVNPVTKVPTAQGVEELVRKIRGGEYHSGQTKTVRFFPPKSLSSELMTEMRRWQLLSWIDWFIGAAEELWIYEDEDYYNSWWTLAELTTWIYRQKNQIQLPKLRIFDPAMGTVRDAPAGFLPTMTEAQSLRVARWYVHTGATQMAPENFIPWHFLSYIPGIRSLPYVKDPVYTRDFWTHPVLDCRRCRILGRGRNRFDLDAFLHTRGPNFFRIPAEQMPHLLAEREITCPRCTTIYKISQGLPQYLWMPEINKNATGQFWLELFGLEPREPGEYFLIPMPSYNCD